jgi:hypothetical protein
LKFTISVDLDWLEGTDSDGGASLNETIKAEIIHAVVSKISVGAVEEIAKTAKAEASARVTACVENKVLEITEQLLAGRFDIVDRYGDKKVCNTSVLDELKKQLDNFLTEEVDSAGHTVERSSYGSRGDTRLGWLIKKNLTDKYDELKRKVDDVSDKVCKDLKAYVDVALTAKLGEGVAKAIGLDAILGKR